MDHAAYDDDNREQHMGDAPGSRPQSNRRRNAARSATAKIAHMAITPKGENGVGDVKISASIMSGGLVIQRPPTWITTATTSVPPIQ